MKKPDFYRLFRYAPLLTAAVILLAQPARAASGDVAGAIKGIWDDASGQVKSICNDVVFPACAWICGIGFAVVVIVSIVKYNKHKTLEIGWPIALIFGLLASLTANTWVWALVGG